LSQSSVLETLGIRLDGTLDHVNAEAIAFADRFRRRGEGLELTLVERVLTGRGSASPRPPS